MTSKIIHPIIKFADIVCFAADGNIGQVGEKIGGPFSKDGAIGSQFDASKGGIAGTVERAVDGPSNPAKKS
jgi:hypothetical protein